jgi:threonine dehydratase
LAKNWLNKLTALISNKPAITEVVVLTPVAGGGLATGLALSLNQAFTTNPILKDKKLTIQGFGLNNMKSPLGDAIKVNHPASQNSALLQQYGVSITRLNDEAIQEGLNFLEAHHSLKSEGASGIAVYPALKMDELKPTDHRLVVSIISGSNV